MTPALDRPPRWQRWTETVRQQPEPLALSRFDSVATAGHSGHPSPGGSMATVAACEQAFATLAARLAGTDEATRRRNALDRSLSCSLTDPDVIFAADLRDGLLENIRQSDSPEAQIKLRMTGDDLVAMVDGSLNLAQAWASGRIKIDAKVLDLIKLRSIF